MNSFMDCFWFSAGFTILFTILIMLFAYISVRGSVKNDLKIIGLISLFTFSVLIIISVIDTFFGWIGFAVIITISFIYIFKSIFKEQKELERQYKNGEITKEEFDKIKKERAESLELIFDRQ